jgi:hypothetical protein
MMACVHSDPELDRALAADSLDGLDHLLALAPRGEPLAAREVAALVRLIRDRCPCRSGGASGGAND